MSVPLVKGWCPGAYSPMASGDGLVVRVRPWFGEVSSAQARVLCAVAARFGSGTLELTSRANLQIRGVAEADHGAVIAALLAAHLLDADPAVEGRRNVVMTPDWTPGDVTHRLGGMLLQALPELPEMPAKFGYAIDTAHAAAWLPHAPADIRFERDAGGALLLVADGARAGRVITEATARVALQEMVDWFVRTDGPAAGRMARHLKAVDLPSDWARVARRKTSAPDACKNGLLIGVPFGLVEAQALTALLDNTGAQALRLLPGRRILALHGSGPRPDAFCAPDDPLLNVHACTGAPGCPQAHGATRATARRLARDLPTGETLHISGCTKGCAHPRRADHTLIATGAGFDLVSQGAPWDAPMKRNLPTDLSFKDIQA